MTTPRLRVLAGPNGSGKSTLFQDLSKNVSVGHWLNPDALEQQLVREALIDFGRWDLSVTEASFHEFVRGHGLYAKLPTGLPPVKDNRCRPGATLHHTYFTAILSAFLTQRWLATGQSFTFETVMSHPGKIQLLRDARANGYRTYLYFVCTENSVINRERVASRVLEGGHDVAPAKLVERYDRSLQLLPEAVRECNRSYLFDNSGKAGHRLVAEYEDGKLLSASADLPTWSIEHALKRI